MILGISGSGRKNKMIHQAIQEIMKRVEKPSQTISLAGKKINGCIGCTECAEDNICKQNDDWQEIGDLMIQADFIIFGAPNYYGMINALAHACLERTFSFRHRGAFTLEDKIGVSLSTNRKKTESDPIKSKIQMFMKSNKMKILGHVTVGCYDQCYECGYGSLCEVGNVVKKHGKLEKIEEKHLPPEVSEQPETMQEIETIAQKINLQSFGF